MEGGGLDVANLARAYRRLVLWFGVQLLLTILGPLIFLLTRPSPLLAIVALLRVAGMLATVVALVIYAYKTALTLRSKVPVVWGVAMLVPLVNAITLLVLSAKATKACRAAGIPVGFLGPKLAEIPPESGGA